MTLNSRLVNLAGIVRQMVESGLMLPYSGSASLRWDDEVYISPREARLDRLGSGDFIRLDVQSDNSWRLSHAAREHATHLACYRLRADVFSVLHLALPHCVALGCAGLGIGAPTTAYQRTIGSNAAPLLPAGPEDEPALLAALAAALPAHNALLLRNQGALVIAPSSDEALLRAQAVEEAARITLLALAATGRCSSLASGLSAD